LRILSFGGEACSAQKIAPMPQKMKNKTNRETNGIIRVIDIGLDSGQNKGKSAAF